MLNVCLMKRAVAFALSMTLVGQASMANDYSVILSDESRRDSKDSELVSEEFQNKMDVVSKSKRIYGNEGALLISGQMSYPVRFKLIDNAKKSIIISTFSIYSDKDAKGNIKDTTTRVLVEKLIAKKKEGVEIKVITDGGTSVLARSAPAIAKLREAGIQVFKFNPIISDKQDANLVATAPVGLVRVLKGEEPVRNRWHEKTMVVDGKYVISGGLNWGEIYGEANDLVSAVFPPSEFFSQPLIQELGLTAVESWGEGSPKAWRDTDVLIKGPVADEALTQLLKDFLLLDLMKEKQRSVDWYKNATDADYAAVEEKFNREYKNNPKYFHDWRPEPLDLDPDRSVRYISQRPKIDQERKESAKPIADFGKENDVFVDSENPHLYMSNFYVNTINKAEKQILWGCHSNRPTPQVLAALKAAAKRGVEIFIVGNSPESARNLPDYGKLMYPLALCHYRDLLERDKDDKGSVRIFEWQKSVKRDGKTLTAGAFHSKVFSVDGVLTSVGSYNISRASYKQHTEGTFVFIDSEFSKTAEEMFQKDLSMSRELTIRELSDQRCNFPMAKFLGGANHRRRDPNKPTAAEIAEKRREKAREQRRAPRSGN